MERQVGSGTFVSSTRVRKMGGQPVLPEIVKSQGKYLNSFLTEEPFQMSRGRKARSYSDREYYPRMGTGALRVPLVYEVASIPEKFIKGFQKKKSPVISSKPCNNMAIGLANPSRLFMRDWLRKKIATIEVKGHAILALTQVSYLNGTAFSM